MIAAITPAVHTAAHVLTLRVIQSLAEGALIGLFAAAVLRLSRHSAGTKFVVWFAALMAIATLPVVGSEWYWHAPATSATSAAVTLPDSWAFGLLIVWAVVSSWFLLRVGRSFWHLRTLRKSCVEVNLTSLDPAIQATLQRQQMSRRVALCTSSKVRVPTAIGITDPAVVIPEWVMQELSTDELNQVLLHELAHLRRWDDWTNLAQQLVKAVFFFHPVVWWIERNAAAEREMACDDAVLAETESPRSYAECLTHLAEKSFVHRSLALAQAALGRIRQTTQRVARILDPNRDSPQSRALGPAVSLVAIFAIACGVVGVRVSSLIAFGDNTPAFQTGSVTSSYVPAAVDHNPAAKIIPAVAQTSEKVAITPAKLILGGISSNRSAVAHKRYDAPASSKRRPESLVQLTSVSATPVPVTATFFVLIENPVSDAAAVPSYQIQMWHVLVLRSIVRPATNQVSRKEI